MLQCMYRGYFERNDLITADLQRTHVTFLLRYGLQPGLKKMRSL